MRENVRRAVAMTLAASLDDFGPETMLRLAVERAVELMGEAARRVSVEYQASHPDIPWREIIGQRNILAHEYGSVDGKRLWQTVTIDIVTLLDTFDTLLAEEE